MPNLPAFSKILRLVKPTSEELGEMATWPLHFLTPSLLREVVLGNDTAKSVCIVFINLDLSCSHGCFLFREKKNVNRFFQDNWW